MSEPLCACGCGEPALYAARHVKKSLREGAKFDQWEERDMGFETPCHYWVGNSNKSVTTNGVKIYGTVYHAGRYKAAHRFIWERERGPIPSGVHLHHLCAVKLCVNTDHLMPMNASAHMRLHRAKLNPDLVRYIRSAHKSVNLIARELGVSESLVSQVRCGTIWADVK